MSVNVVKLVRDGFLFHSPEESYSEAVRKIL